MIRCHPPDLGNGFDVKTQASFRHDPVVAFGGRLWHPLDRMIEQLTNSWRLRAAAVLAVLYAVCVLAPAAALAFGDASRAAHCVTDDHRHGVVSLHVDGHDRGTGHVHQDGTTHEHSKMQGDDDKALPSDCCGIACLSALPAPLIDTAFVPVSCTAALPAVLADLTSRVPDLLDRPPISLLSL
jgi:hypothetical protein